MTKAYCFSNSCIIKYLSKTDEKFIELTKTIAVYERMKADLKKEIGFFSKTNKNPYAKKIAYLKSKSASMIATRVFNNGAPKGDDFIYGSDCPDCGWSLKVENIKKRKKGKINGTTLQSLFKIQK